jgi:hypothetical protein
MPALFAELAPPTPYPKTLPLPKPPVVTVLPFESVMVAAPFVAPLPLVHENV